LATSVVKIFVKAGQEAAFEAIIRQLVEASNASEPGIRFYQAFRGASPGEYWMLESFADLDALKAHTASDHFRAMRADLGACFDRPPEIQRLSNL
jgi:quinol monooxygenase YgiN